MLRVARCGLRVTIYGKRFHAIPEEYKKNDPLAPDAV